MLRIERHADLKSVPSDTLRLAYDDRKKSRLRAWSEHRREVGIFLAWGSTLRDGDLLAANSGEVFVVKAAPEPLSEVRTRDWHLLTRAAYHLGNRHVPLQIEPGILRYQRDHVLDEMLEQLGLHVDAVEAPFEPEAGAYAGGGHSHDGGDRGQGQGQGQGHVHSHGDDRGHVHSHGDDRGHAHPHHDHHNKNVPLPLPLPLPSHTHSPDHDHGHSHDPDLNHLLHRSRNS